MTINKEFVESEQSLSYLQHAKMPLLFVEVRDLIRANESFYGTYVCWCEVNERFECYD